MSEKPVPKDGMRSQDDSPARRVLERLLRLGEQAWSAHSTKPVSIPMSATKCKEYCALRSLQEFERFEAEIALAVRSGGVAADPVDFGREDRRLQRLRLIDLESLAAHLNLRTLGAKWRDAEAALAAHRAQYPVIDEVLAQWRSGRQVRGHGPDAASKLQEALRAFVACRADEGQERLLRRESVRIFGDSKRLESLTTWLDLLVTGEIAPSGLEHAQVWSALGLRREPQPVLIAGTGHATLDSAQIELCRPYLGLPVDAVRTLRTDARYLLTIENLTSFHDAARAMRDQRGLLIFTGGMPSPPWRAFYARLLSSLPDTIDLYHWGDIDEGGFRIAAALATVAKQARKTLKPWRMSPADVPTPHVAPAAASLDKMRTWAERAGWQHIAAALGAHPVTIEQEALDPLLP